ncbi:MAG: exodeoxyribonuclease V subunit gamma [Wenzhouxiangellaceae bacterium]|nr:exodeoxyribonuclease V subunit gamma [Wenzhouxiangellaceae bacterium]
MNDDVTPGLALVQSNCPEQLRQAFLAHIARHPLQPLEDEVVLVQSMGIGRWLQLGMAEDPGADDMEGGFGIGAAVRFQLPARFLWQAYRIVLGVDRLPENSLFDADRLQWLAFAELGRLTEQPVFEPLARYLTIDAEAGFRRYQLAGEIASLFETYQFYRADWLLDWEEDRDVLRRADQGTVAIPDEQRWQPALWRALVKSAGPAGQQHRGRLHADFVAALERDGAAFPRLPRRISVFGITTLPEQSLRALAALSRHVQVLVFVTNPCRYYWGNLVEAREDYRRWNARHRIRPGLSDGVLQGTDSIGKVNPLLASWGKQGRDFIGLLDAMDRPEQYREWFDDRIDLFSDHVPGDNASLLSQLQQSILDLEPPPNAADRKPVAAGDDSVHFVSAHSRQREVEILHDELLARFQDDDTLQPRDIVVMVPSIEDYAPHIEAVFGQFAKLDGQERADRCYIPYSIGDRSTTQDSSFLRTVRVLLELPRWRVTANEIAELLQVPAVQARFDMAEADLERVSRWLEGSGVRWGIDRAHRNDLLGTDQAFNENSWAFGLDRMMLGYACGDEVEYGEAIAFDEISVGDAKLVGALRELLSRLAHWRATLSQPISAADWPARVLALAEAFMVLNRTDDALDLYRLDQALDALASAMEGAGIDEPLDLDIVTDALDTRLEQDARSGRLLAGQVTFCTLVPMRAIPFRMVCLLGMNDGDYPRTRRPTDFDLIASHGRPGDRSRRDDDRYLFLEALLSARERFYISWIGRSVRDNSKKPPSVLVAQLRDFIARGWRLEGEANAMVTVDGSDKRKDAGEVLVGHITVEHPLQPFSRRYFGADGQRLRTHAREWASVAQPDKADGLIDRTVEPGQHGLAVEWPDRAIGLKELADFCKKPVDSFLKNRLQVRLIGDRDIGGLPIDEPLSLDILEQWQLRDNLLRALIQDNSGDSVEAVLERRMNWLARQGQLPLGLGGAALARTLVKEAHEIGKRYFAELEDVGSVVEKQKVALDFEIEVDGQPGAAQICDWLPGIYPLDSGIGKRIEVTVSEINPPASRKWGTLARYWPAHLVACASGLELNTILVGKDRNFEFPAIGVDDARTWLLQLLACWVIGQTRPLPVEPKSSCKYLMSMITARRNNQLDWRNKALADAEKEFIGSKQFPGPAVTDPALSRFFPDFQAFLSNHETDGFCYWSERVYGPMVEFLSSTGAQG